MIALKYLFSQQRLSGELAVFVKLCLHVAGVLRTQADTGLGPRTKIQISFEFQIRLKLTHQGPELGQERSRILFGRPI